MKANSPFNETVIANALVAIFERLGALEKATNILAKHHLEVAAASAQVANVPTAESAVLLERLERLTLKRHAVLTATLGGVSYQEIAKLLACDLTTVKLHLKAALKTLDIRSRSVLLAASPDLIKGIPDSIYKTRFGIGKRWWLEERPGVLAVLQAKKPANNQYTK